MLFSLLKPNLASQSIKLVAHEEQQSCPMLKVGYHTIKITPENRKKSYVHCSWLATLREQRTLVPLFYVSINNPKILPC